MRFTTSVALVAANLAVTIATANAETFELATGEVIQGSIVRAVGNTVSITLAGYGMRQIPVADIRRVEIEMREGPAVTGTLFAWTDGVYGLETSEGFVTVRVEGNQGSLTAAEAPGAKTGSPSDLEALFERFLAEAGIDFTTLAESQNEEIFQDFADWLKKRKRGDVQR